VSKILELYAELLDSKQRFLDEIFVAEIYKGACPKLTIFDLGAYEGEFSFYCLNFAKKIYAFEPDPTPFAILKKRIKKYDLNKVIKIYNKAISANGGSRVFHATSAGGSTLLDKSITDYSGEKMIKIKSVSLKDFINTNKINKIDILKIDVEGSEKEIFMDESFKKVAPKIECIIGEDHQDSLKEIIEDNGFRYYAYGGHLFMGRRNK